MADTTLTTNTPQTIDAKRAFEVEQEIKHVKSQVQSSYLELGRLLKEVKDNQYYKALGFDSLSEWLSSPDIVITRKWAFAAISVYELYVVQLGKKPEELRDIDYTKLSSIVPVVRKHPEEADEWLDKAQSLRRIDLQSEIKVKKISDRVERIRELEGVVVQSGVIHGDPLEEVKKLTDNSVDAVITAPLLDIQPYVFQEMFSELKRVLVPNGSVFVFVDYHNLFTVANALQINDFRLVRDITLLYNTTKKNVGLNMLLPYHETVLWASRSDDVVYNNTEIERDVWAMQLSEELEHPSERPVDVVTRLIKMATDEGKTILDPFAGSGTIAMVGKTLGRTVVAIEPDELWYRIILRNLQKIS